MIRGYTPLELVESLGLPGPPAAVSMREYPTLTLAPAPAGCPATRKVGPYTVRCGQGANGVCPQHGPYPPHA